MPQALYPDWAHDHWVWLSSDQANQTAELALVQGYLARNVPVCNIPPSALAPTLKHISQVGAVNIDSDWSTGFNNFVWNSKYPNATAMIEQFHSWGVLAQMINTYNAMHWPTSHEPREHAT